MGGISTTTVKDSKEFTIHVPTEYDYRFSTEQKDEIIHTLKVLFLIKTQTNLPIFGIFKTKLDEYTTTEKDMD